MVLQSLIHSIYTTESYLLNLPPELIVSVLEETRWQDLLTVRRVCRTLYDFSRSHAVWCGIFSRYLAGLPRIFRRPQTYLDRYTPRELEHLVISQICAEIGWIKPDATWLYRHVKLNENLEDQCLSIVPKSIRLLEGGRWLLVGTETGSIITYDLHKPEPKGEILLQPDDIMDVQEIFDICVEIDRTSPTLAVNVALTPFSFYSG
ncbi:hypothetical protein BDQ12DRAFT_689554 [Crucibulum laeve]|uniref:F-box domain-containing protein n=1 Tax=Crucibulum laeve TaxID=68775 RepID=A0A5C3LQK9_9AGAR|nr:hypothetical protein BDQ12DRAFT_689554 [Crucibulum laeve]